MSVLSTDFQFSAGSTLLTRWQGGDDAAPVAVPVQRLPDGYTHQGHGRHLNGEQYPYLGGVDTVPLGEHGDQYARVQHPGDSDR